MKRLFVIAVVGCVLRSGTVASASIADPVKTDAGLISGTTGTTPDVRVFKGIPFAAPPVGPLRWRAPQPVAHWDGVRKADQIRTAMYAGSARRKPGWCGTTLRQQVKTACS